jgi:Uma2 family endonuclease
MAANPQREPRYTVEEYFELESKSELRHEYIDGEIVALAGASKEHVNITMRTLETLFPQLRRGNCRAFSSDLAVRISDIRYVYPDLSLVCGEARYQDQQGVDVLTNPILVIEILSPTTEIKDRVDKFAAYRTISSLQEYVLISQDKPLIERYLRQPNDEWLYTGARGLEAALELRSVGCVLALADVYADVEFAGEGSGAASADVEFDDQTEEA